MKQSAAWDFLSPSSTLLKFTNELVRPDGALVLDIACGFGRNAIVMAAHGCDVICVDRDFKRLQHLESRKAALLERSPVRNNAGLITTICADMNEVSWPFVSDAFDTIICVHFICLTLIPCLLHSLKHGGHIYMETFGGQGENYLVLPRSGETKTALGNHVEIIYYKERAASRMHNESVSVKALARKI